MTNHQGTPRHETPGRVRVPRATETPGATGIQEAIQVTEALEAMQEVSETEDPKNTTQPRRILLMRRHKGEPETSTDLRITKEWLDTEIHMENPELQAHVIFTVLPGHVTRMAGHQDPEIPMDHQIQEVPVLGIPDLQLKKMRYSLTSLYS